MKAPAYAKAYFKALVAGKSVRPLVIAEMSGNHNGSLKKALKIVDAAADAGAHALKLQTYTADTMTLNLKEREFVIRDIKGLWTGKTLYELYREASTPWEWHKPLFERCRRRGLLCFSTPFDASAVDFLEKLDAPCYKIASFENTDIPLIRKVAATGKPLFISTGMASLAELGESVAEARKAGCRQLILLKCASVYPADAEDLHLATLDDMRRRFRCAVGISDHTPGWGVAVAAVALGAVAIEKHFTLSRRDKGVDAAFSLEPAELKILVEESMKAWRARGQVRYGPTEKEKASLVFRRSLYVVEDMRAGTVFTEKNLRAIRPGLGLPPKHYDRLLGRKVLKNVKKGTPLKWNLVAR